MDGTGLCERGTSQKEIQGLITSSFYWGHPNNTYFPNAKHSRRTVEPLATWTTSGNCTSIFGSYSPMTPTKRNTQMSLKCTIISNKSVNYSICTCKLKSSQSFFPPFIIIVWFILSLLKDFWDSREPWYLLLCFCEVCYRLAAKLSEGNSKRCLSVMSNAGRLCQRCQRGRVEERQSSSSVASQVERHVQWGLKLCLEITLWQ